MRALDMKSIPFSASALVVSGMFFGSLSISGCRPAPPEPTLQESAIAQNQNELTAQEQPTVKTGTPTADTSVPLPSNNMKIGGGAEEFTAIASGKEPGNKPLAQLIVSSYAYLHQQQAQCTKDFGLGHYDRFDMNQGTGEIIFSRQGKPGVIAKIQVVGDVSTKSNTWLWAWANSSINPILTKDSKQVKQYGQKYKFEPLTLDTWPANEADGWMMTAITAKLTHAKGAYRAPSRQGPIFVVFTSLRKVAPQK